MQQMESERRTGKGNRHIALRVKPKDLNSQPHQEHYKQLSLKDQLEQIKQMLYISQPDIKTLSGVCAILGFGQTLTEKVIRLKKRSAENRVNELKRLIESPVFPDPMCMILISVIIYPTKAMIRLVKESVDRAQARLVS
jgi:hypothetical protein